MNLAGMQRQLLGALLEYAPEASVASAGLRVYANNVRGQLVEALRETYERAERWFGVERFTAYANAYIEAHPSGDWNLNRYGADFPAFLAGELPPSDPGDEIAWLDGALRDAFYGADVAPVALHDVTVTDWDQAIFRFIPSLRVRSMRSNAPALWAALNAASVPPDAMVLPEPVAVRVWRADLTPRFTSMAPWEAECLVSAMSGATFGALCAQLAAIEPETDVTVRAGQLLRAWFDDGLVSDISDVSDGREPVLTR
ncbi:HvfC/BufC family peptide modification chaperone [Luteibacter sp.]|uniref:HvfC/BufC family peptide modification chaperone n=1 Tax=Luteibacter sp. TaxID=1886636 RepID=UPI003F81A3E8